MVQDCKKCIHYDTCVQQFRDAKANGEYDCTTEEEYFSFVDACPCTMYLDKEEYVRREDLIKEIFDDIDAHIAFRSYENKTEDYLDGAYDTLSWVDGVLDELRKKYEENGNAT